MIKKEIIVDNDKKILNLLQDYGFSFVDVNKMLRNKDVKVNGKTIKENLKVFCGDEVVFYYSQDMLDKKYEILFENEDVYIVYKSAGIEVEGEKGLEKILKNAIAVHRLDRNTEGLVIFAKNREIFQKLIDAFKRHIVHKFYVTEVVGKFQTPQKVYKAFLLKDSDLSLVKIYKDKVTGSVEIQTSIKTLKAGEETSLLEIELITGKTHQIRAHLAYLGHAIVGDGKYGKNIDNKKFKINRQKLACFKIRFEYIGIDSLNFKEFVKTPSWLDF